MLGASLSWLYCDDSYVASSTSDVSVLSVFTVLHPQVTRRHRSKFSAAPMSIWMSQNSSTVSSLVVFYSHRHHGYQIAGQLQLHCLSRLNPFRPYVCAFTYLSSLIVFMADMSSSSLPCCSVECMQCKSHTWAHQYTRIHGAFQGVHESREPESEKRRVNDT